MVFSEMKLAVADPLPPLPPYPKPIKTRVRRADNHPLPDTDGGRERERDRKRSTIHCSTKNKQQPTTRRERG